MTVIVLIYWRERGDNLRDGVDVGIRACKRRKQRFNYGARMCRGVGQLSSIRRRLEIELVIRSC